MSYSQFIESEDQRRIVSDDELIKILKVAYLLSDDLNDFKMMVSSEIIGLTDQDLNLQYEKISKEDFIHSV